MGLKQGVCLINTGLLKMNFGWGQIHILLKYKYYNNKESGHRHKVVNKWTENRSNSATKLITVHLPKFKENANYECSVQYYTSLAYTFQTELK